MKTQLPHKDLEQFMQDNMDRAKVYTISELYMLYKSIMNRDGLIENYCVMDKDSLRKRVGEWLKPGGWIVKNGRGVTATYFKRVVHKSNISAAELKKRANEIINCIKGRLPWAK